MFARLTRVNIPSIRELAGSYPRHLVLVALVGGLLIGPRSPAALAIVLGAFAFGAVVSRTRRTSPASGVDWPWPAVLGAAVVATLGGAVVADARLAALDRTTLQPASNATIKGHVLDAPRERSFGVRVVPVETAGGDRVQLRLPRWVERPRLEIGTEVEAAGRLRALRPHETFERRRHVHTVLETDRVTATGRTRGSPIDALRTRAERGIDAGLRGEQRALARGMVLGQDHALPEALRDDFRTAGLAHLVAASGANVMLLVALVIGISMVVGIPLRWRLLIAMTAIALYVPVAGAGPSIQRAGVMGAAGLVAALAGRPASRWYAILLAAAATLVHDPGAAEDAGWQLSFAAVIAILALHGRIRTALTARGVPAALAEATALTTAATAGTAPLLSLHFDELSLVSLPANVLAAPAVAPVMWLGTAAAILGGEAAELLGAIASLPLGYLAWLGHAAASLPNASVPAALPGPLAAAGIYAALIALMAAPEAARRTVLRTGAILAAAGLALAPGPPQPPKGFAMSFLAIGQGDATLLQHGPHAVLVDTGPPGAPILDELRKAGVRRLDALFVTHASADHEGNAERVMEELPVDLLLDGTEHLKPPPRTRRLDPRAGQTIRAGPLRLDILWPPPGMKRAEDPNLTAAVSVVTDGPHTALLTADAESPVTLALDLPDVDVLKVAHHGSEDPGLPQLLERTKPELAVIPVGRNTYGHPAPSTLAALEAVPAVRRTDRDGTVLVAPGG